MDFQHRREETFSPELEQKILEMTESDPAFSYLCLSRQLGLVGVGVSPSPVRYVWQWDGPGLRYHGLPGLEEDVVPRGGVPAVLPAPTARQTQAP
jgi:hypothetical protein